MYLQTELIDPKTIMDITPATMAGYGLALLVLCVGIVVMWKLYIRERNENDKRYTAFHELNERALVAMDKVIIRLEDQEKMHDDVKFIRQRIDDVIKNK